MRAEPLFLDSDVRLTAPPPPDLSCTVVYDSTLVLSSMQCLLLFRIAKIHRRACLAATLVCLNSRAERATPCQHHSTSEWFVIVGMGCALVLRYHHYAVA